MTLIEIVVSMFLIFVLFVLYLAAINTVALVKKTSYSDIAYHIANKQMESLREVAYTSLTNTASTPISDPQFSEIPSGAGIYSVSDYASMPGVKEIVVIVTWNDGASKSLSIRSLAGSGGINQ